MIVAVKQTERRDFISINTEFKHQSEQNMNRAMKTPDYRLQCFPFIDSFVAAHHNININRHKYIRTNLSKTHARIMTGLNFKGYDFIE